MKPLSIIGKILFALPMAFFGIGHFSNAQAMAGLVPVPGGVFWVYFTGVALIAAAVSIVIGKYARLAGILLGILLLIFAIAIWAPMLSTNAQMAMPAFVKDIALAGASFFIASVSPAVQTTSVKTALN